MAMTRCEAGHFYSAAQHSSCPYCGIPDLRFAPTVPKSPEANAPGDRVGDKTLPQRPGGGGSEARGTFARGAQGADADEGKTVGVVQRQLGVDPTVGWLVCIQGPDRGRDYRIRSGRNFIGRGQQMHICVGGDPAISREKHAVISYDPKHGRFALLPGDGSGLTYLNESAVEVPVELRARDVIELGETRLMFVPFCGEEFTWRTEESPSALS